MYMLPILKQNEEFWNFDRQSIVLAKILYTLYLKFFSTFVQKV